MMNAPLPDLGREDGAKASPPKPHRLVVDIDPSFMKQIFDLPQ